MVSKVPKKGLREEGRPGVSGAIVREICEEYDYELMELEISVDHVHILLFFPPNDSIGSVVRTIKSITARQLFREFPSVKSNMWSGKLWEDSYFSRTVGDRMICDVVAKYIQHHWDMKQGPAQLKLKLRKDAPGIFTHTSFSIQGFPKCPFCSL